MPVGLISNFRKLQINGYCIVNKSAVYLKNVLRSATKSDLQVPRTRLKFGERAFSVAAPKAWNDLPLHLCAITNTDTFKRRLKTHFFCKFYDSEYDFM